MAANGVKTRHKDYDAHSVQWKRVRDVCSGQDAIYASAYTYLSPLVEEDFGEYLKRLRRAPFYNASWRTIAAFVGMLFRKPPTLEVPKELEKLLEDVTMSGVSFNNFAQDVVLEDLSTSWLGVLVDYPMQTLNKDGTNMTRAQADKLGMRPSMVMYNSESIINWRFEFVNNHYVLTQVRLWESHTEIKNEFEEISYPVIRVLDLIDGKYRVRRFKEESEEQLGWDIFPTIEGANLDEIPFYFIGPDGSQREPSEPVLIDLIDLNIKHFQVGADYEHGCHMTALPTPVVSGMPPSFDEAGNLVPPTLYIGSTSAWILPTGADAKFLEFQGGGLTELRENLKEKKAEMASIGARMLTPEKAGVEAAETLAMRHAGENSILSAVAIAVSDGLTKALIMFARWAGIKNPTEETIKFAINRDFMPYAITPQALTSLLATVQAGKLSSESFFDLLKRGDLIDSDISFEDEQGRIDADPALPLPLAPAGAPGTDPAQLAPGQPKPGQPTPPTKAPKPGAVKG